MKKGILFALAALCVSAVQAVTFTWNNSTGSGNGGFDGFKDSDGNNVTVSGTFTLVLDFTATQIPGGHANFIKLLTSAGTDKQGEFRINQNGSAVEFGLYRDTEAANWYKPSENNDKFTTDNIVNADGKNIWTMTFNYDADTQTYTSATYEMIFANGGETSKVTGTLSAQNGNNSKGFGGDAVWTELWLANGVTMNRMELTVVPEPTALALLALGVAGLALRRKVA